MNKVIILNILQELIIKYQNNELNEKTYNQILDNYEFCSITSNLSSYKETSLLALLFKTIPYYQILAFLNNFINYLKSISTNNKSKLITSLIEGMLCDLIASIDNRVTTEINAHIYKLCQLFYINLELDYEISVKILKRNILNPEQLVGLDVAENINYNQETIEQFTNQPENLREKISQKNFTRSNSIERKLTTLLCKFFDQDTLSSFEDKLSDILKQYKEKNSTEADLLNDTIMGQFQIIKKNTSKKWQEKRTKKIDDPNQIDIFSLIKNKA